VDPMQYKNIKDVFRSLGTLILYKLRIQVIPYLDKPGI